MKSGDYPIRSSKFHDVIMLYIYFVQVIHLLRIWAARSKLKVTRPCKAQKRNEL